MENILSEKSDGLRHIGENTDDEKARRLSTLSGNEKEAYKWLLEGYSERWTTETLGLERTDARLLFHSIYRKLGIGSAREIIHCYMDTG